MRLTGKRIIIVLGSLELGGAERQAILLAKQLAHDAGASVQVWGFQHPDGRAAALCDQYQIPWRIVPFRVFSWHDFRGAWLKQLANFAWALRRERPHAILPYYTLPNIVCGLTWRFSGAKVCLWNQRDEGATVVPELEPWAIRLTRSFSANSPGGARYLTEAFRVPLDSIRIVPNGVELDAPLADRETWRVRLGMKPRQLAACMIANLTRLKDHPTLLRAWRMVVDRQPGNAPPVLLLAGQPVETGNSLRKLAVELGIESHVRFLGQVADIAGLLQAVDLGVHSAPREGCPNGVLEMMAAGLPIAATDIEGVRMAMGPEAAPYLAPNGNADALAKCILCLAKDESLRGRVGKANSRRIDDEFSPHRMFERTLEILAPYLLGKRLRESSLGVDSHKRTTP